MGKFESHLRNLKQLIMSLFVNAGNGFRIRSENNYYFPHGRLKPKIHQIIILTSKFSTNEALKKKNLYRK